MAHEVDMRATFPERRVLSIESSIKAEFRSNAAQGKYALCKENLDMILDSA